MIEKSRLDGHEDWILDLSFLELTDSNPEQSRLLLASSSKDGYIRLWNFSLSQKQEKSIFSGVSFNVSRIIDVNNKECEISLEALLIAHENWVYSVNWHPPILKEGKKIQPLLLLSASMDRSMIVW